MRCLRSVLGVIFKCQVKLPQIPELLLLMLTVRTARWQSGSGSCSVMACMRV